MEEPETRCANHPDRPTRVSCSTCAKPICHECMVYAPVGIKCRECAKLAKTALRKGKPAQFTGAALYGFGAALVGFVALQLVSAAVPFAGFFGFLIYGGYGYFVGEAVARGAKGNRGTPFMIIAGVCAALGLTPVLLTGNLFALLFVAIAVMVAASRLKGV